MLASIQNKSGYKHLVKLVLNGKQLVGFVDSGNNTQNCISVNMLKKLGLTIHNDVRPLHKIVGTANKKATLTILGRTRKKLALTFEGYDKVFYTRPLVIKNLAMDFNIAGPFLVENKIDQIHSKGALSIDGVLIPVRDVSEIRSCVEKDARNTVNALSSFVSVSSLYANQQLRVKPNSISVVPLRVSEHQEAQMSNHQGFISGQVKGFKDLELVDGYSTISQEGVAKAMIINRGDTEVVVQQGTRLGTMDTDVLCCSIPENNRAKKDRKLEKLKKIRPVIAAVRDLETARRSPRHRRIENLEKLITAIDQRIENPTKNWGTQRKKKWLEEQFKISKMDILSDEQKQNLESLLLKYFHTFSFDDRYGHTKILQHEINLKENTNPIRLKNRPINPSLLPNLKEQVNSWLDQGVIEPSSSPWCFQLLPVKKKNNKIRWCIDYRRLNSATVMDAYPLPNIEDLMVKLGKSRFFSSLDAAGAYHTVEIREKDREKTAFHTPFGLYQFKRMSFGLCNAPATFSRLIQRVLEDVPPELAMAYLDDCMIHSSTIEDHLATFEKVLKAFDQAGLTLQPAKCHLFQQELDFLGHKVSAAGIKPMESYVKVVKDWPQPTSIKEVRQFMGKCSYYRKFIKNFSRISAPLSDLTKTKNLESKDFAMTKEAISAFEKLKQKLIEAPILAYPDFQSEAPFILDTDFSLDPGAIGAVLSQVQEGKEKVIVYAARKLLPNEKNYSSNKGEILAVLYFMNKFKYFLAHRRFILRVDHQALKWLKEQDPPKGMVARWLETLSNFDFEIQFRPGKKHGNADALSRIDHAPEPDSRDEQFLDEAVISSMTVASSVDVAKHQDDDETLKKVRLWVQEQKKPEGKDIRAEGTEVRAYHSIYETLYMKDNVLYRKAQKKEFFTQDRLCVPISLQLDIIKQIHSRGHLGINSTQTALLSKYYFPGAYKAVEEFIDSCGICQKKRGKQKPQKHTFRSVVEGYPWKKLSIDFVGPLKASKNGNTYILTVKDTFSRWLEAFPTDQITAEEVARILEKEIFCRWGPLEQIHSDQGSQFTSQLFGEVCKTLGIQNTTTPSYNPKSNPVERSHRDLGTMLRAMLEEQPQSDWETLLPSCVFALNTARNRHTGVTPFFVMFGREAATPTDLIYGNIPEEQTMSPVEYANNLKGRLQNAFSYVRTNLQLAVEKCRKQYTQTQRKEFHEGSLVWLFTPKINPEKGKKLSSFYSGPYRVTEKISDVLFRIVTEGNWNSRPMEAVVSIDRLSVYRTEAEPRAGDLTEKDILVEDEFLENIGETAPASSVRVKVQVPVSTPMIRDLSQICREAMIRDQNTESLNNDNKIEEAEIIEKSQLDNHDAIDPDQEVQDNVEESMEPVSLHENVLDEFGNLHEEGNMIDLEDHSLNRARKRSIGKVDDETVTEEKSDLVAEPMPTESKGIRERLRSFSQKLLVEKPPTTPKRFKK